MEQQAIDIDEPDSSAQESVTDRTREEFSIGKGVALHFAGTNPKRTKGICTLYQKGIPTKTIELSDKVGKKIFTLDVAELGVNKTLLSKAMNVSRQTLHNYQEIKGRIGVEGLIHSYSARGDSSREEQRKINNEKLLRGNKAEQVAQLRAQEEKEHSGVQNNFNFSLDHHAVADIPAQELPFAETHEWEASRYAGLFIYWPILIAHWSWLGMVVHHYGRHWKIFSLFLLMAGHNIRSIEQLKNTRLGEAAHILGLSTLRGMVPTKERAWEWFYSASNQQTSTTLLKSYFKHQMAAGLISCWIWCSDGHLLPYSGKENVHYSFNTQRNIPVPGRTNQVVCDEQGRIVDFVIEEGKGDMKGWIIDVSKRWRVEDPSIRPLMIYDREGYDKAFFKRQIDEKIHFVTWEKHIDHQKLAELDDACYQQKISHNDKPYSLFEQTKEFSGKTADGEQYSFSLRQIQIWNHASDRRTCGLTNAPSTDLTTEEAARAILNRWGASENTFKHIQERHPLHYHPGFKWVESKNQMIANPEIKEINKTIKKLNTQLDRSRKKLGQTAPATNRDGTPRKNSKHLQIKDQIDKDEREMELLKEKKKALPERVDVSGLEDYKTFKEIDNEGKYLFDFVTTSVWNARKKMVEWLREHYNQENEVVDLFYAITKAHGWIRNTEQAITVRLEPLEQPRRRRAQEKLCRQLTALSAQAMNGKRFVVEVGNSPI